jgi:uncharacterized protein (DUF58 family)
MNQMMVRQLADEGESGYHLCVDPAGSAWSADAFERLCSTACALAEDLFCAGRLSSTEIVGRERQLVRGRRELHEFFDNLAELTPETVDGRGASGSGSMAQTITFKPRKEGGVAIYVDGTQAGQAEP